MGAFITQGYRIDQSLIFCKPVVTGLDCGGIVTNIEERHRSDFEPSDTDPAIEVASPSTGTTNATTARRRRNRVFVFGGVIFLAGVLVISAILGSSSTNSEAVSYTHLTLPTKRIV